MSETDEEFQARNSNFSAFDHARTSTDGSPMMMSPWNQPSPFAKSPWSQQSGEDPSPTTLPQNSLIGSLVREEGHIYSLAAIRDLLYTGSDSKNIRVWKNLKEFSAFKSNSGLVKAIIISGEKIFTGHQDGKIRVWKVQQKNDKLHKRAGTLPKFIDIFKASIRPKNYVEIKKKRTGLWIKHSDAISCLSLDTQNGLLYSASWDRTFKVWRLESSKCLESVKAHDDAINSVVAGSGDGSLVFTGSADGTVKVWRREMLVKVTKHTLSSTILKQESAVTALVVGGSDTIYCGSSDGLVNFWERDEELTHGGVLKGHKLAVLCLAAAREIVFTGSADKTICVWKKEGKNHTCLSILSGHTGPVKCLAVEASQESKEDDRRWVLYSGSLDKSIKVWSVSEQPPDINPMADYGDFNTHCEFLRECLFLIA